jgi:hypothetical protein
MVVHLVIYLFVGIHRMTPSLLRAKCNKEVQCRMDRKLEGNYAKVEGVATEQGSNL